jgi:hypothetical protein
MLGGELGNSSDGTARADALGPRFAPEHFNTVLLPVTGEEEIEPARRCASARYMAAPPGAIRIGGGAAACDRYRLD